MFHKHFTICEVIVKPCEAVVNPYEGLVEGCVKACNFIVYSAALHEVSRYGAHWLLHNGLLPYGRTQKACQLKPNFASVLGLVPPTLAEPGVKALHWLSRDGVRGFGPWAQ